MRDALRGNIRCHIITVMTESTENMKSGVLTTVAYCTFTVAPGLQRPVKPHLPVNIRSGSLEISGKVHPIGESRMDAEDSGYIQLRFEKQISCARGRDFQLFGKRGEDLGSGTILIPGMPVLITGKIGIVLDLLRNLELDDDPGALSALLHFHHPHGVGKSYIMLAMGLSRDRLDDCICEIGSITKISLARDELLMDDKDMEIWYERTIRLIKEFHIAEPCKIGPTSGYIESNLKPAPARAVVTVVVEKLKAEGVVQEKDGCIQMTGFKAKDEDKLDGIKADALDLYINAGYSPPRLREAAEMLNLPEKRLKGILSYICEIPLLVKLDKDTFMSREHFINARVETLALISKQGDIEISEFRDLIGCSRRIALMILERFDKKGWTSRRGDIRIAGPKAPAT